MLLSTLIAVLSLLPTNPSILTIPVAEAAPTAYSTTTLRAYALEVARRDGLDAGRFLAVVGRESGFEQFATSTTGDCGVAQWNPSFHAEPSSWDYMTCDRAMGDPLEALDLMGEAWRRGYASWWVAWRGYERSGWPPGVL